MKAIESQHGMIQRLRREGARWSDIAAALAEQGVTQGRARDPLSGKRLTALMDSIRRKQLADKRREARRVRSMTSSSAIEAGIDDHVRTRPEAGEAHFRSTRLAPNTDTIARSNTGSAQLPVGDGSFPAQSGDHRRAPNSSAAWTEADRPPSPTGEEGIAARVRDARDRVTLKTPPLPKH